MPSSDPPRRAARVHPAIDLLAQYAWRLIVITVVFLAVLLLITRIPLAILPLAVALLLTVVLAPIARWLERRGVRPLLATWMAFLGFIGALVLAGFLIVPAVSDETEDLGDTVSEGLDDVQDWVVDNAPFEVTHQQLDDLREEAGDAVGDFAQNNQSQIVSGAILVLEVLAGLVLAMVMTFFLIKDGPKFQTWVLSELPERHRELARRLAGTAWWTLGGYLRGSATLGVLEGIVIGTTLAIVGASLAIPVAFITFLAAFVPLVGAVTAGVIAVLVTLVTAGTGPALVVAIVALIVQQLDNDLLAPWIFGKALSLHPLVILVSITAFGQLAGLVGTFVAVPITAVTLNTWGAFRQARRDGLVAWSSDEPRPALDTGGPPNST